MNRVESKMTALYDVLNRIPLSVKLHVCRTNDLKACRQHLPDMKEGDVVLALDVRPEALSFADRRIELMLLRDKLCELWEGSE